MQGAISDKWDTRVSFYIVVPCFIYIALWALWVWNQDGRKFGVSQEPIPVLEDAANGVAAPLGYAGRVENYESSIKEDLETVEKSR